MPALRMATARMHIRPLCAAPVVAYDPAGWMVIQGECGRPATHAWRVRDRTTGETWTITRCSTDGHADTIKQHLRDPECRYVVVQYLLPLEGPDPGIPVTEVTFG